MLGVVNLVIDMVRARRLPKNGDCVKSHYSNSCNCSSVAISNVPIPSANSSVAVDLPVLTRSDSTVIYNASEKKDLVHANVQSPSMVARNPLQIYSGKTTRASCKLKAKLIKSLLKMTPGKEDYVVLL